LTSRRSSFENLVGCGRRFPELKIFTGNTANKQRKFSIRVTRWWTDSADFLQRKSNLTSFSMLVSLSQFSRLDFPPLYHPGSTLHLPLTALSIRGEI